MPKDRPHMQSALRVIGHSVTRVDAHAKIAGAAEFSADRLSSKHLLHGKTLRSPHAHAEILSIDTSKAEALPGVRAVITYHDALVNPFEAGDSTPTQEPIAPVYLLNRTLRHVGDEVAAVAADTEEIADEALRLIQVEYRSLPFVLDAECALEPDAPSVRGGTNLAGKVPIEFFRGDIDRGMREAEIIVEESYRTQSTSRLPWSRATASPGGMAINSRFGKPAAMFTATAKNSPKFSPCRTIRCG